MNQWLAIIVPESQSLGTTRREMPKKMTVLVSYRVYQSDVRTYVGMLKDAVIPPSIPSPAKWIGELGKVKLNQSLMFKSGDL
jgi:hypothetical protein